MPKGFKLQPDIFTAIGN